MDIGEKYEEEDAKCNMYELSEYGWNDGYGINEKRFKTFCALKMNYIHSGEIEDIEMLCLCFVCVCVLVCSMFNAQCCCCWYTTCYDDDDDTDDIVVVIIACVRVLSDYEQRRALNAVVSF